MFQKFVIYKTFCAQHSNTDTLSLLKYPYVSSPPIVPLPAVVDLFAARQAKAGLPTGCPFQYIYI